MIDNEVAKISSSLLNDPLLQQSTIMTSSFRFGNEPCTNTANLTFGDIFEKLFQSLKIERLFSLKRGKRNIRTLSFELRKGI